MAATAHRNAVPLLTKDQKILAYADVGTIW